MVYKIVIEPRAQDDLDNAVAYYLSVSGNSDLVIYFLEKIEVAFEVLSLNPFFQIRSKNYRAIPISKFPYLIFYEVFEKEKVVKVLAVFNTNKDHKKWP